MTRMRRPLVFAWLAVVLAASAETSHAAQSRGPSHAASIRTLPAGPASVSAAVMPALAVDAHGTVYSFDGSCGAKPQSCWCDVFRQGPTARHPEIVAGHSSLNQDRNRTPAQRLNLGGCRSIAVDRHGDIDLLAVDRSRGPDGTSALFTINPSTGAYRERTGCLTCDNQRRSGWLQGMRLNGNQAAFDAEGNVYLANDQQHAIQKIAPSGEVSIVMRARCRQRSTNGPVPELYDCTGCLGGDFHLTGYVNAIFMCPEWLAVDAHEHVYYVDRDIRRLPRASSELLHQSSEARWRRRLDSPE